MKKYVVSIILLFLLVVGVSAFAETNESYFCNGTDTVQIGTYQFYSNSEDEDKLYKYDENTKLETKVCDDHIISLLKNSVDEIYFLSYENGITKLKQYKQNGSIEEIKPVNEIVNSFAIRDNIIYFVQEGGIYKYDLNNRNDAEFISNENIAFLYFSDYSTLKYYIKNSDLSYDAKEYKFYEDNTSNKKMNLFSSAVTLMSADSYSPRLTAPATDNPYYTSLNVFHTSGYGMVGNGGNCTCYAYGRSYENLGYKPSLSTSNAENWYNYNINYGFYGYGKTPYLGAVAVWAKGVIGNSSDGAGHVAVVEVIDGNTVTTSESGWKSFYFKTVTRSASDSNFSAASSYTFQGFIYVMGQVTTETYTNVPSNCSISANYTSVGVGDTVQFTYNIENATTKYLGIDYAGGSRYKSISVSDNSGKINFTFTEPGTYCCIIEGSNNKGYNCSPGVYIRVINTKPTNCSITANKTSINSGETVTFSYNILGATAKGIGIDSNGSRYDGKSVNSDSGSITYTFNKPGTYCCIIEGYNNIGYSCSSGVWVTVSGEKPKNCTISSNKTNIYTGDEVTFSYNIDGATVKGIGIDCAGSRYASFGVDSSSGTKSYVFTEPGTYCCIIEGYNNNGYSCSPGVYITVTQKPNTISANYRSVGTGDRVTFTYSIDYSISTEYRGIGIDHAGSRYKSFAVDSTSGTASFVFTEPGTYCCIVEGKKTGGGYACSPGVYVTVIDSSPINCNISANTTDVFTGDTVAFTYNIEGATAKCLGFDRSNKRFASVGVDSDNGITYYTFNEPGTYCCIIEGYNNKGYNCSPGVYVRVRNKYNVSYNSLSGDITPSSQIKIQDENLVLSSDVPHRLGYTFLGWSDNVPNATSAAYPAGGTFTGNYDTTMYAVWQLAEYDVSFNANGGTTPVDCKTVTYSSKYGSLPEPSLAGYTFIGWFTEPKGGTQVTNDTTVTEASNHILYAQWEKTEYRIEYNMNEGEGYIAPQTISYGTDTTITSYIPTRDGYRFLGWSRTSDAVAPEFSSGDIYTENTDITLYAVWKIIPSTETSIIKKSNYSMVNITVHNLDEIAKVVLATYKNEKLSDIQIEEYNGEDLSLAAFLPYDTVKVMLWEDMSSMRPLCENEILH